MLKSAHMYLPRLFYAIDRGSKSNRIVSCQIGKSSFEAENVNNKYYFRIELFGKELIIFCREDWIIYTVLIRKKKLNQEELNRNEWLLWHGVSKAWIPRDSLEIWFLIMITVISLPVLNILQRIFSFMTCIF